jgi:hypothetical protein
MASCNTACVQPITCVDQYGCDPSICPSFEIKQHDTKPHISASVSDCDGPLDLTDVIVEVSMWAKAKLKKAITATDTYFALADNVGFNQSLVGDVIVMNRVRAPEQMLVIGHDETNKLIQVQRGYHGSPIDAYPKGNALRIMRVINAFGDVSMDTEDITQVDGTVEKGVLLESRVTYEWNPNDTCMPGCYWLEFKLLKMNSEELFAAPPVIPTFTSITPSLAGCGMGTGVEWVRRIPSSGEGFLVSIAMSPTSELLF